MRDKLWTPANVITLTRICLVPVFVLALLSPWPEWFGLDFISAQMKSLVAAGVFILISCTDWVDGYLARSRGEVTDFGKFMDPLADKILVAAALLALVELGVLPSWPVLIILAREFIVSGVRMIAATKGEVIAASWYGKAKTVFQIVAIVLFLVKDGLHPDTVSSAFGDPLYVLSWLVMIVALVLTIVSMLDYLSKARHLLGFAPAKARESAKGPAEGGAADGDAGAVSDEAQDVAKDGARGATQDAAGREEAGREAPSVAELDALVHAEARAVVEKALASGTSLATAESLTGGMISSALTSVPGSSGVVRGGVVSYVNEVKHGVLGVDAHVLEAQGAVCAEVAEGMARGARRTLGADVAVAVTGIAGPGGAEEGKPVGTVWFGFAAEGETRSWTRCFGGTREQVRQQTALEALRALAGEV
ncbi:MULTISPECIES: CDP-diacylglycerol--glycerol-3-phosphate 3-phosphatidyltransferase [unclassified Adlercreutzia]|uniref:CDP-diacylglycerol--glycerol-3-phosphate 3-phosphatidyltransferase n=1 Tax=unclassified Adlercreutzia TaxID=2636013 RepID=UPI0013EB08C6|nr:MULTISPECIES: CDP-diacylglycerol--glycerol-3-phosphate 3-phosphatidyltransferase [unclassified Adlercreutzia]